jgi:hypothetical protein
MWRVTITVSLEYDAALIGNFPQKFRRFAASIFRVVQTVGNKLLINMAL